MPSKVVTHLWLMYTLGTVNVYTESLVNELFINLQVFLLTDPLADVETSKTVEWMDHIHQATQTTILSNSLSCLSKCVARTKVDQDTRKDQ